MRCWLCSARRRASRAQLPVRAEMPHGESPREVPRSSEEVSVWAGNSNNHDDNHNSNNVHNILIMILVGISAPEVRGYLAGDALKVHTAVSRAARASDAFNAHRFESLNFTARGSNPRTIAIC